MGSLPAGSPSEAQRGHGLDVGHFHWGATYRPGISVASKCPSARTHASIDAARLFATKNNDERARELWGRERLLTDESSLATSPACRIWLTTIIVESTCMSSAIVLVVLGLSALSQLSTVTVRESMFSADV